MTACTTCRMSLRGLPCGGIGCVRAASTVRRLTGARGCRLGLTASSDILSIVRITCGCVIVVLIVTSAGQLPDEGTPFALTHARDGPSFELLQLRLHL